MRLADLAELVRLPAALTVPGDTLAGAVAAGPLTARSAAMPVASVCLYWAGMTLNDWADRELDAVERPERPIPSGRVRPGQALGLAAGLTGAGVATATYLGGRKAAGVAAALGGVVWAYDTRLKHGPLGPAAMAAARGLDVLLGSAAAGRTRAGALPAALLAGHTASVTMLSRGEVHGTRPDVARTAVGVTASVAALLAASGGAGSGRSRAGPLPLALAATYAVGVGRAQSVAIGTPDADAVRRATGAGIRGMIPLQAALVARRAPWLALGLLAAGPVARAASKVVSPT